VSMDDSAGSGAGRDLEGPGRPPPDTSPARARWLGVAIGAAVLLSGVWLAGRFPYSGEHYGIWSPDPGYLALSFAAVTGGSVFGDQCSPISDTTILSSLATGCDLMDHVTTQLPMAIGAAVLAAVLYTVIAALLL